MKKKIMVLGAAGMAGHVITLSLRKQPEYDVVAVSRTAGAVLPNAILDVTDQQKLRTILQDQKPDIIVNCIGTLNQMAENDPANAILINSYLPHYLAAFTKNTKTRLIHISTDCVFSGKKGGYNETDLKDGQGYYSQTKALGEVINDKDTTIRTSIIGPELNENGIGLFNWFSKQEGEITGYTRAFWTGVTTTELAKAITIIIEKNISGLYHLVNSEKIDKHSLLQFFLQVFEKSKVTDINPFGKYESDKSLVNTRSDHSLEVPAYKAMLTEMKKWMIDHIELYPHYANIL